MSDSPSNNLLATLRWQSHNTRHEDISFVARADFTDKALANHASLIRKAIEVDESWQQDFEAGTLVLSWNPDLVTQVDRKHFGARSSPVRIQPELGRFYPKRIVTQGLDCSGNELQPLKVIGIDNIHITVDCNHPLAKFALNLSLTQKNKESVVQRPANLLTAVIENGPGLQAADPYVSVDFFKAEALRRIDESSDSAFYKQPRLVSHLDATARSEIARLYARFLQPGMKVLDLMSSWQSHLPDTIADLEVTGLGMNDEELQANPQLDDYCIHDLNSDPKLPFENDSFDLVICTASIEYLIQPLKVMQEIQRVLKSQCTFIATFTERWFPPKAIAIWSHLHPYEKLHFVAEFFHQTHGFDQVNTFSLRGLPRPQDDPYFQRMSFSDPVYAVWGQVC